jgi:hypothetical protein
LCANGTVEPIGGQGLVLEETDEAENVSALCYLGRYHHFLVGQTNRTSYRVALLDDALDYRIPVQMTLFIHHLY